MKNKLNKDIREYIKSNTRYLTEGYQELATKFKVSYDHIRHVARKLRKEGFEAAAEVTENTKETIPEVEVQEPVFSISEEVMIRKENATIKSLRRQLENAISEYDRLSDMYDVALALKTQEVSYVARVEPNKTLDNEATAIVQVSDGHFAKLIKSSTVNGLNEYNPDIARKRMEKLAANTIKLIRKERIATNIDNFVIIYGGDFLENSMLHEHSEMTTAMSPMEETLFARELLHNHLKTITDACSFTNVKLLCIRGNHPRITRKMNASIDYRMNYEVILYAMLKADFPKFDWIIPESEIGEVEIYGKIIRAFHAHQVRYGGGIGGLTIPLNKYIMRLDQIKPAYHNFIHHYHNYSFPTHNCTLNGSVVGMDPYALSLGCTFQEPIQSFQLMDRDKGMTARYPIFCL